MRLGPCTALFALTNDDIKHELMYALFKADMTDITADEIKDIIVVGFSDGFSMTLNPKIIDVWPDEDDWDFFVADYVGKDGNLKF
jgi:hypothetical protein